MRCNLIRTLIAIGIFIPGSYSLAGDVQSVCESKQPVRVIRLSYRDRVGNLEKIRSSDLGGSELARYLKVIALKDLKAESELARLASEGNARFISQSKYKDIFLKYSSADQKSKSSTDYAKDLLALIDDLVPKELNKTKNFLNIKDDRVSGTSIRVAGPKEVGNIFGAVTRFTPTADKRFKIEIIFSMNDSEPMPYLIPLVIHELQHGMDFSERIKNYRDEVKAAEHEIIDEAIAFDLMLQTYIALVKRNPEIFCNWLYPSWSYGELVVPLSWTMGTLEEELGSGAFISRYATMGSFKDRKFLLDPSSGSLRDDLKNKIRGLGLKYVR